MRAAVLLAILLAASAGAGCMGATNACRDGYPLVLQVDASIVDPKGFTVQTALWDCDARVIAYDETCLMGFPLYPRLVFEDVTYVIGTNVSAVPLDEVACETEETRHVVMQHGTANSLVRHWDGTILRPAADEPERLAPGFYWLEVEVSGLLATTRVEVKE